MQNRHTLKWLSMKKGLEKMNKSLIIEIVENIKEAADELKALERLDDVQYGELLGYAETLSIIKDAHTGYNLKELGLDFNIDKKYL